MVILQRAPFSQPLQNEGGSSDPVCYAPLGEREHLSASLRIGRELRYFVFL